MLALVSIFLVTLLISISVIWMYRRVSAWHGFSETLVGRSQPAMRMKMGAQQGFISLERKTNRNAKAVKLRGRGRAVKTPWGW
jgi:hypothetical protein